MKYNTFFISLVIIFLFAGCARTAVKPTTMNISGINLYTKEDTLKTTYLKDNQRFCLEPMLDVAATESEGVSLGLQQLQTSESIGERDARGAVALGGVSPEVLIVSELMYRACELAMNLNADKKLSLKIYFRFLETIEKLQPVINVPGVKVPAKQRSKIMEKTKKSDN